MLHSVVGLEKICENEGIERETQYLPGEMKDETYVSRMEVSMKYKKKLVLLFYLCLRCYIYIIIYDSLIIHVKKHLDSSRCLGNTNKENSQFYSISSRGTCDLFK